MKIVNRTTATRDLRGYRQDPDTTGHRYWGMGNYVWNNTGNTTTLRNLPGTRIDYCSWTTAGTGVSNC